MLCGCQAHVLHVSDCVHHCVVALVDDDGGVTQPAAGRTCSSIKVLLV